MKRFIFYCMMLCWLVACQVISTPVDLSTGESLQSRLDVSLTSVSAQLDRPGYIFGLPDGDVGVIEQVGIVRRISDGSIWFDMRAIVDANSSERGLFSIAINPPQTEMFVSYTQRSDRATVVARIPLVQGIPDITRIAQVIAVSQPYANHNGGFIAFGPDGLLYIATGDGGSGNDPHNNAQNPQNMLGKLLRIDVRSSTTPYTIPAGQQVHPTWLPEIVAVGLRNPWRFGFVGDNHIWIADVGQNAYEELNVVPLAQLAGANFGWRIREGNVCNPAFGSECDLADYIDPATVYAHDMGRCSITGGEVVTSPDLVLDNAIIYGDFCSGTIWVWNEKEGAQVLYESGKQISSFGRGHDGQIYLSDYKSGEVFLIQIRMRS